MCYYTGLIYFVLLVCCLIREAWNDLLLESGAAEIATGRTLRHKSSVLSLLIKLVA